MKKTSLLLLSALATFGMANAETYYVIQNGQLVNGEQMAYDPTEDPAYDLITPGDGYATFSHNGEAQYKDVRIDFTKATSLPDLSKTWVLKMEYEINETETAAYGDTHTIVDGKKPVFIFGLYGATPSTIDLTKADAVINYDAKFGAAGVMRTEGRYIYANSSITTCEVMVLSFVRESSESATCKIKNLWFESEGDAKPFYAENFETVNGKVAVYSDNSNAGKFKGEQLAGGVAFESEELITLHRMWENNGTDASGFFYDDENYHGLQVDKGRESAIFIKGISIPEANDGKIYASAVIKQIWSEEESEFGNITDPAERPLNIYYQFDNGQKTELFKDSALQGMWQADFATIDIQEGAKTIDLIFEGGAWTYIVDNVKLSTKENVESVDAASEIAKAIVFPNPASDIITVAGDNEKIEVIALNGAIVASANGNSVSVANLAAGSYIVKAYSANGVAISSFIKK